MHMPRKGLPILTRNMKNNKSELYHWGIKGQKWGIRRFQNEDGSYTPKGQAENNGHGRYSDSDTNIRSKSSKNKKNQNEEKNNSSKSRSDLITKRNIAIGIAAASALIIGGYLTYDYIKNDRDIIVKGGEYVQRIADHSETKLHDSFYASFGEHDNKRYEGMMQRHFNQGNLFKAGSDEMYVHKLLLNKDIRAANDTTARKIFNKMLKNDEFKKSLTEYATGDENNNLLREAILRYNGHGVAYEGFNRMLADYRFRDSKSVKMFTQKLKDLGYNAIADVNDKKYSGFEANSPLIVFDKSVATLADTKVKDISNYMSDQLYQTETAKALTKYYLKLAGAITVTGAGIINTENAVTAQKEIKQIDKKEQK